MCTFGTQNLNIPLPELGTLVSVHGTSEDGSLPLSPPNFTTLLDLEEMKEPF